MFRVINLPHGKRKSRWVKSRRKRYDWKKVEKDLRETDISTLTLFYMLSLNWLLVCPCRVNHFKHIKKIIARELQRRGKGRVLSYQKRLASGKKRIK